jgi:glycosyltransferase involved in cell wall biosynthesis
MRLLFVHERFGAFGGAEANVLATASEFRRRGHTVGIIHGPDTDREADTWHETFADCFPLQGHGALATTAAIRSFAPDVLFVHKWSDAGSLAALATSGVPVVRMVHDHDLYCLRGYKYNPLNRSICTRAASPYCVFPCGGAIARGQPGGFPLRWVSYGARQRELAINRHFHRLIVASEYMKDELLRNGFGASQVEIHAPVPRDTASAFQCSFSPQNRIVYAGQIIRGKGVDVLLQALALVRVPFECIILGDGNHRARCEDLGRELGLAGRVRFAGFVPQPEVAGYYRDASLAVMSSLWPEPFGAVGLEAMRCGLPVVAFDAGGIREWLIDGRNGYLVPWMDRVTYARKVEALLRDKTLARTLGENGRRWAEERFGFSQYISGLESLFGRVASHRPPKAESKQDPSLAATR